MSRKMFLHLVLLLVSESDCFTQAEEFNEETLSKGIKPTEAHSFTLVVAYKSDAVLPCHSSQLDADSIFRYWWYKNEQEIGRLVRKPDPVIQMRDGALWLQNATPEDSGIYSCHVFTDSGTRQINVTLIVLEAEKAPYFSKPTVWSEAVSRRKAGSSVEFQCPANGMPAPRLEWYKNEDLITNSKSTSIRIEANKWSIYKNNLTTDDTANYTCRAINQFGSVNRTFTLLVFDGVEPDLSVFHPLNTTVKYGSSATFQCRVRSDVLPNIQWLKGIANQTIQKPDQDVMKVHGEYYRLLRSSQVLKRPDGSYLNKLVILDAREADSGKYICLGANKMGYSFRSAYLTVLQRPRSVTGWSHHISVHPRDSGNLQIAFPTVGGGLGIALAMAVVGAFYFICRRRRGPSVDSTVLGQRHLLPSTSIEMDSIAHSSLSKSPLISNISPALSEVELSGGVTVTKLYENAGDSNYKLRDDV